MTSKKEKQLIKVLKEMLPYFKMLDNELYFYCNCLAQKCQLDCIHNKLRALLKKANEVLTKMGN